MANPQKENGHIQIATELFAAITQTPLTSTEIHIVLAVIRRTYGFNKKEDRISLTQFEKMIRKDRTSICRAIKTLVAKNILVVAKTTLVNKYSINKDYETWVVAKPILVAKMDLPSGKSSIGSGKMTPTIYNIQNTYTKYIKGKKIIFCKKCHEPNGKHKSYCDLNQ